MACAPAVIGVTGQEDKEKKTFFCQVSYKFDDMSFKFRSTFYEVTPSHLDFKHTWVKKESWALKGSNKWVQINIASMC